MAQKHSGIDKKQHQLRCFLPLNLDLKQPSSGNSADSVQPKSNRVFISIGNCACNCPVCVIEMKKWIKGDSRFAVVQVGRTYLFPSDEQKQIFIKNPNKYTPALGGKCTVCLVEMGKTMDGSVQFAALHEGRLFLFPGDEQKRMFQKNPAKYASGTSLPRGNAQFAALRCKKTFKANPSSQPFTRTCDIGFLPKSSSRCSSQIRPHTKSRSLFHWC